MLWVMEAHWKLYWADLFSNVLISRGLARLLRTLLVKILRDMRRKKRISLGLRQRKMQNWTTCLACQKKKTVLCLNAVTDGAKMNREEGSVSIGIQFFKPALKARGITNTEISCGMFRKHLTTSVGQLIVPNLNSLLWKKILHLTLMEFRMAPKKSAGDLSSQFLFNTFECLLEGGTDPEQSAESRTVFISKTSDIDDNGRIIRSSKAFRPLTLCNCTMWCIHPSQRRISSKQRTDNIFEIENPPLWPIFMRSAKNEVSCWRTSLLPTPASITPGSSPCLRKQNCLVFICYFLRNIHNVGTTHVEFAGTTRGQFLMARGCETRLSGERLSFCNAVAFDHVFRSKKQLSQRTMITWTSCSLRNVLRPIT